MESEEHPKCEDIIGHCPINKGYWAQNFLAVRDGMLEVN
jgi:hypothetical protein